MIAISPSALYAGEARIPGITDFRNASAAAGPAFAWGAHGVSLPSSQVSATMYDSVGVVLTDFRSVAS